MNNVLILYLSHAVQEPMQWLYWNSKDKKVLATGACNHDELEQLAQKYQQPPCALIVPGEYVRTLNVTLPNRSKAALNTIPFLIEAHLSTKLEKAHIVTIEVNKHCATSLITEQKQMEEWIAAMSAVNLKWIIPDYQLLNASPAEVTLCQQQQRVLAYSDSFKGVVSATALNLLRTKLWPEHEISIKDYEADENNQQVNALAQPALLVKLASGFNQSSKLNLLQGAFSLHDTRDNYFSLARIPALLSILLFGGWCISMWLDNMAMHKEIKQIEKQMVSLYRQADPRAKKVTNPMSQLKVKLRQQSGSQQSLLKWLVLIAPLIKQHGLTITSLKYDNPPQKLYLQLEGRSFEALENVAQQINQASQGSFVASLGALQQSASAGKFTTTLTLLGL